MFDYVWLYLILWRVYVSLTKILSFLNLRKFWKKKECDPFSLSKLYLIRLYFGLVLSWQEKGGDVATTQNLLLLVLAELNSELVFDAFVPNAHVNVANQNIDATARLDHSLNAMCQCRIKTWFSLYIIKIILICPLSWSVASGQPCRKRSSIPLQYVSYLRPCDST